MAWPLSQDYNEAIQEPGLCFADDELRAGQIVTNSFGLPMPRSGAFADVYEVQSASGVRRWAVKCFTRAVASQRERYAAISANLRAARYPFAVDFRYLDQGIRVHGMWYPVLKMDWVEGLLLNEFIREQLDRPGMLEALANLWARLARRLWGGGIAHGDLQHGNVILARGRQENSLAVKLIDYDGLFVPALKTVPSGEVGHPAYQHPRRARDTTYNAEVDRFSLLVIYVAIRALAIGGRAMWDRYDNGDNILFRQADLEAPTRSPLFHELLKRGDPALRYLTEKLIDAARLPMDHTPLLEEVITGGGDLVTNDPWWTTFAPLASPTVSTGRQAATLQEPSVQAVARVATAPTTTQSKLRRRLLRGWTRRRQLVGAIVLAVVGVMVTAWLLLANLGAGDSRKAHTPTPQRTDEESPVPEADHAVHR
jgi:hypothetical protein